MDKQLIKRFAKMLKHEYYIKSHKKYLEYVDAAINFFDLDSMMPTILSENEYKNTEGITLYRGIKTDHISFHEYKRDFASGKFQRYYGDNNFFGMGLYFTTFQNHALEHTNKNAPAIISVKIKKDAKIVYWEDVHDLLNDNFKGILNYLKSIFNKKLSKSKIEDFLYYTINSYQYMPIARLFGFDGIRHESITKSGGPYGCYVIFCRDCLVVNKTEFSCEHRQNFDADKSYIKVNKKENTFSKENPPLCSINPIRYQDLEPEPGNE